MRWSVSIAACALLALGCSDASDVVGPRAELRPKPEARPLTSTTGVPMLDLGNIPDGTDGRALDINDRGAVVGRVYEHHWSAVDGGFYWTAAEGLRDVGFRLTNISNRGLAIGYVGGIGSVIWTAADGIVADVPVSAFGGNINDAGNVAGTYLTADGEVSMGIWSPAGVQDLGYPSPAWVSFCEVGAINNRDQVAVHCWDEPLLHVEGFVGSSSAGWRHLGNLPGGGEVYPYAINDRGEIAGVVFRPESWRSRAFLWSPQTGMQQLPEPQDETSCEAYGMNNRGQVVGACVFPVGYRAALWTESGEVLNLGTTDYHGPSMAHAINDHDRVAGCAHTPLGSNPVLWDVSGIQGSG